VFLPCGVTSILFDSGEAEMLSLYLAARMRAFAEKREL
jgi:hypothetical protein